MGTRYIQVSVDSGTYDTVINYCKRRKITLSKLLRQFLSDVCVSEMAVMSSLEDINLIGGTGYERADKK